MRIPMSTFKVVADSVDNELSAMEPRRRAAYVVDQEAKIRVPSTCVQHRMPHWIRHKVGFANTSRHT